MLSTNGWLGAPIFANPKLVDALDAHFPGIDYASAFRAIARVVFRPRDESRASASLTVHNFSVKLCDFSRVFRLNFAIFTSFR